MVKLTHTTSGNTYNSKRTATLLNPHVVGSVAVVVLRCCPLFTLMPVVCFASSRCRRYAMRWSEVVVESVFVFAVDGESRCETAAWFNEQCSGVDGLAVDFHLDRWE